jgi:hypothetical protein
MKGSGTRGDVFISCLAEIAAAEAHCIFVASLGGGAVSNAIELRRLSCLYATNTERAEELMNHAAGIPRK